MQFYSIPYKVQFLAQHWQNKIVRLYCLIDGRKNCLNGEWFLSSFGDVNYSAGNKVVWLLLNLWSQSRGGSRSIHIFIRKPKHFHKGSYLSQNSKNLHKFMFQLDKKYCQSFKHSIKSSTAFSSCFKLLPVLLSIFLIKILIKSKTFGLSQVCWRLLHN